MTEPRAQSTRSGPDWGRGVAWLCLLGVVCAASLWALVLVDCALTGGGWSRPTRLEVLYLLGVGLAPLMLALGAVVMLWRTSGPPFSNPRKRQ